MDEKIKIEYDGTTVKPVFGGKRIESTYTMTHTKYGQTNAYRITCELRGMESADPHLSVESAEYLGDPEKTNDETLTEQGAIDLFESEYA